MVSVSLWLWVRSRGWVLIKGFRDNWVYYLGLRGFGFGDQVWGFFFLLLLGFISFYERFLFVCFYGVVVFLKIVRFVRYCYSFFGESFIFSIFRFVFRGLFWVRGRFLFVILGFFGFSYRWLRVSVRLQEFFGFRVIGVDFRLGQAVGYFFGRVVFFTGRGRRFFVDRDSVVRQFLASFCGFSRVGKLFQ